VEIDHGLSRLLRERFSGELQEGTLELVEGDILEKDERLNSRVEEWWMDGSPPQVIANLPYSISGPFLARLPSRPLKSACLLLQREVAVKACGKWGDKAYGPLTVRLNLAFHARLGRRLPPEVFWPRPQIDSAFLHLSPRSNAPSPELDSAMAVILKFAFGQRRKRLLGRLEKMAPAAAQSLRDAGVSEQARPEQVEPELWRRAAEALE
jgi:16S rRNA (adenine1518-N6/adenine1519-N6)-dimethyltransferase